MKRFTITNTEDGTVHTYEAEATPPTNLYKTWGLNPIFVEEDITVEYNARIARLARLKAKKGKSLSVPEIKEAVEDILAYLGGLD